MLVYNNKKMVYTKEQQNKKNIKYRNSHREEYNKYQSNLMAKRYHKNPEVSKKQNQADLKRYYLQKELRRFRNILMPDL